MCVGVCVCMHMCETEWGACVWRSKDIYQELVHFCLDIQGLDSLLNLSSVLLPTKPFH